MYITELTLENFRNYSKYNIKFSPYYNFIIGDNGQGKTNIIEAIYMLGVGKSFRITTDKDIIKNNNNYFYIKAKFYNELENTEDTIEMGYNKQKKQVKYNGQIHPRISDWIAKLKVMVFLNQDIEFILGSSSTRRKYVDMVISLSNKKYLVNLQKYLKTLKNRNKTLKMEKNIFDIYNNQLVEYGSCIIHERIKFFEKIKDTAKSTFEKINPDINEFKLNYKPNIFTKKNIEYINEITIEELRDKYEKILIKNKNMDIKYKTTVAGPHRDDFEIKNNEKIFKRFASQGQNRVAALTIKIIAAKHIEKVSGQKIILLLDDILLDLDGNKKNLFLEFVKDHQCFFTSTNKGGIGESDNNIKMFIVKNGHIEDIKNIDIKN